MRPRSHAPTHTPTCALKTQIRVLYPAAASLPEELEATVALAESLQKTAKRDPVDFLEIEKRLAETAGKVEVSGRRGL